VRPREPRGFQRLYRFSRSPNIYNKPGNLLSLKEQVQQVEKLEFGHSFGTAEKQGRQSKVDPLREKHAFCRRQSAWPDRTPVTTNLGLVNMVPTQNHIERTLGSQGYSSVLVHYLILFTVRVQSTIVNKAA
jgi:hypothetical protein